MTTSTTTSRRSVARLVQTGFLSEFLRLRAGPWKRSSFVISLLLLLFVVFCALFPGWVVSERYLAGTVAERLKPPSIAHWFGTDQLGRDVFARVVHGAGLSMAATTLAVFIGTAVGSLIGLIAGYAGEMIDNLIMRLIDVVLSIPGLLLSLAIITALGPGPTNVALAVGISTIAMFARVMRAQVVRVRQEPYVEAAHAAGVRDLWILIRHILPNSIGPVLSLAVLEIGAAMLSISSLSFLGFGAPAPAPEWGSLVSQGRNYVSTAWWLTAMPGLVIMAVVLAANRVSRAITAERPGGM